MTSHSATVGHYYGKLAMLYPKNGSLVHPGGTGKYCRTATPVFIGIANYWTISFYIKRDTSTSGGIVIDLGQTMSMNHNQITALIQPIGSDYSLVVNLSNPNGSGIFKTYIFIPTNDTNWHHWAITWDGTNLRGYKDGVEDTAPIKAKDNSPSGPMTDTLRYIGISSYFFAGYFPFIGKIGNVAIWSEVLTSSEVLEIARGGYNTNLLAKSNVYNRISSIKHWYRFEDKTNEVSVLQDYVKGPFFSPLKFTGMGLSNVSNEKPAALVLQ